MRPNITNIGDDVDLSEWGKKAEWHQLVALNARSVLRALPIAIHSDIPDAEKLIKTGVAISYFRSCLINVTVATTIKKPLSAQLLKAADDARASLIHAWSNYTDADSASANIQIDNSSHSAICAALAANEFVLRKENMFGALMHSSVATAPIDTFVSDLGGISLGDANDLLMDKNSSGIFQRPLWGSSIIPEPVSERWSAFASLHDDASEWAFWIEWYQGFWDNKPMSWELQNRVALGVVDDVWEQGVGAVAEAIREIDTSWSNGNKSIDDPFYSDETARGAKKEVAARREDVLNGAPTTEKDRLGIGGNNPPVELENYQELEERAVVIWASITSLETHLEQEGPFRADVEATLQELEGATNDVRKWLARKADLTVDTLIKWGVPPLMLFILSKVAELDALINALKVWVQFL